MTRWLFWLVVFISFSITVTLGLAALLAIGLDPVWSGLFPQLHGLDGP